MNDSGHDQIVLAIESAIEGGSLSLLRGGAEIGSRIGAAGVSRAEDLLVDIDDLLKANAVKPRDLHIIASSAGPGSFTGLRIGIATALGLARGSGATFASVSLLFACASQWISTGTGVVVLPMGRGAAATQPFSAGPAGVTADEQPRVIAIGEVADYIAACPQARVLLHQSLAAAVPPSQQLQIIGPNLAVAVALECSENPTVTEPLFLSKS